VYRTTPIFLRATGRLVLNLIKPLRMLRDGGNADEENQNTDDVRLQQQDRIGVHGKLSRLGVQDLPREGGRQGVKARSPTLAIRNL